MSSLLGKVQGVNQMNMDAKKFEITDIAHEKYPFLHRIRALRDVGPTVKAGDLGGFVEGEWNLSQEDESSWIFHDAIAANMACVESGAILRDQAVVCGEARVRGNSIVADNARVEDHAVIDGAWVDGFARVSGHGMAFAITPSKFPVISGDSTIHGIVSGNIRVTGEAVVLGDEKIVNEALDQLVVTEKGRRIERDPNRDQLMPCSQYLGRNKPKQKRKGKER